MSVDTWIGDWNNNRYRAAEMSYAHLRLGRTLATGAERTHAPLIFGETGASGPGLALLMGLMRTGTTLISVSGGTGGHAKSALTMSVPGI
ncbi:hypothetical protein [Pelagivirga sediminicola]|nr:hypothetical protein [Pelagivirga sediminicola]